MAIGTKVHFNPSTLKVHYNSATDKVFVTPRCPSAGTVTVTFSGVTECGSPCVAWPSDLNDVFVCAHNGGYPWGEIFCVDDGGWRVTFACLVATGTVNITATYLGEGCGTEGFAVGFSRTNTPDDGSATNAIAVAGSCGNDYYGYYDTLFGGCSDADYDPATGYGGTVTWFHSW